MALTSDNKVYWIIKMPLVFLERLKNVDLNVQCRTQLKNLQDWHFCKYIIAYIVMSCVWVHDYVYVCWPLACQMPVKAKKKKTSKTQISKSWNNRLLWPVMGLGPETGFSAKATIAFQWATVSSAPLLTFLKMIGTKHKSVEMSVSVKDLLVFKRNSEWLSENLENMQES